MNNKLKENFLYITYGICLFLILSNINHVVSFFPYLAGLFLPIVVGILIAFVLNVPLKMFEKAWRHVKKLKTEHIRILSLISAIVMVVLLFLIMVAIVLPEFINSVLNIIPVIKERLPQIVGSLDNLGIDVKLLDTKISAIMRSITDFDLSSMLNIVIDFADNIFGSIVGAATGTLNILFNVAISFIIAIYILLDKRNIEKRTVAALYAFVRRDIADYLMKAFRMLNDTYYNFFSGQCIDAVILGILLFIALNLFRIPYASITAMLAALLSFIPYIGALSACMIGVILVLMVDYWQALLFFLVYQSVQFIEDQLIYPHVVGSSVGLSPLLTLIAVMVGGTLFGVAGMIFFIPLTAVIYNLFKEEVERRLAKNRHKQLKVNNK